MPQQHALTTRTISLTLTCLSLLSCYSTLSTSGSRDGAKRYQSYEIELRDGKKKAFDCTMAVVADGDAIVAMGIDECSSDPEKNIPSIKVWKNPKKSPSQCLRNTIYKRDLQKRLYGHTRSSSKFQKQLKIHTAGLKCHGLPVGSPLAMNHPRSKKHLIYLALMEDYRNQPLNIDGSDSEEETVAGIPSEYSRIVFFNQETGNEHDIMLVPGEDSFLPRVTGLDVTESNELAYCTDQGEVVLQSIATLP